ncbi:metabotropic glutamate receptor 2-like protein [Dinothrombium tinctorium]|uniref:Metabotropic glutamate receptor 2-like protein n=1 Tax=Dinothrombium tinctorium TaxID=1965070 RepID=A0A3S3PZ20_9ACAR|nr:metabotropic glutamate receptor 2-like protein [Dinothrombium tinctorium]RWS11535.1 metabotropic glutamate receptor 2-like protein [Dinothrombium tinctorium]RWS15806.1 metabotropic glutamate receptor 2-like protein [Dinothrombium tinctorium]
MSFSDLRNVITTESTVKTIHSTPYTYDPFSSFNRNLTDCVYPECSRKIRILEMESTTAKHHNINDTVVERGKSSVFFDEFGVFKMREETWVPPLIGLSSLNILIIAAFEIFVIYKAFRTVPSRRHLFLGQVLLLGLLISSAIGFAFVPKVNWISCTCTRVALGIGYTVVFGTLLVKTVFLLSLHSGTYLPISYQAFLLFFIVATQIAIDVQWLLHSTPAVVRVIEAEHIVSFNETASPKSVRLTCNHSLASLLYSMLYNLLLIILATCLSVKIRGYRENFREALFIAISMMGSVVVWMVWFFGATLASEKMQDAFVAYGAVVNAFIVFVIMFVPKARQLASLRGHDCGSYYQEEREDTDSPDSIYAPSFVHIKPSLLPLMSSHKSNSNWNFYKQFNGGTHRTHQISPHPPIKPIAGGT